MSLISGSSLRKLQITQVLIKLQRIKITKFLQKHQLSKVENIMILILLEHVKKQVNFHVREVAVFEILSQLGVSYKTIICCSHLECIFNV